MSDFWNKAGKFLKKVEGVIEQTDTYKENKKLIDKYKWEASRLTEQEIIRILKNGTSDRFKRMGYKEELKNRYQREVLTLSDEQLEEVYKRRYSSGYDYIDLKFKCYKEELVNRYQSEASTLSDEQLKEVCRERRDKNGIHYSPLKIKCCQEELVNRYQNEASTLSDEQLTNIYEKGISDNLKCVGYKKELKNRGLAIPENSN